MIHTLSVMSTDLMTNEGILDLFRNASWENLLVFVLFSAVIVLGLNRATKKLAKPQQEQNVILAKFANSIESLVKNNAVEERSRDERHERYLSEIGDIRERINIGFSGTHADIKEINIALVRYIATVYGDERKHAKEVAINEINEINEK